MCAVGDGNEFSRYGKRQADQTKPAKPLLTLDLKLHAGCCSSDPLAGLMPVCSPRIVPHQHSAADCSMLLPVRRRFPGSTTEAAHACS